MALSAGSRLGVYEVSAQIGEGGMGEAYRARDTSLDRDVALKVLPEAFTSDPDRLARFEREAKVLASLNHPNMSLSPTISLTAAATQMGMVIGTAAYMSPEQASGKPVDKRADVWAFGAVLFEMLTGARPFAGDDVSKTLAHVIAIDPDWSALPSDLPPILRTFLRACLEKDPKRRIHDVADVRLALEGAFDTAAEASSDPASPSVLAVWQRPVAIALLAATVAAAAGLAGWFLRPAQPEPVSRFRYALPSDHVLRRVNRPVMAVSPDGRQFVYNTTNGLYLRSMDTLEARLLPGTEELLDSPVFSPDGQSLAYAARGGLVKRLSLAGGAPVVLGEVNRRPSGMSWAADGTIFVANDDGILRVSENGGTPELVIRATESEALDSPQLLPDGDLLMFTVGTSVGSQGVRRWSDAQIAVESLTTGERTLLLPGKDARYLPSGHLVYALEDELFGVGFDAVSLTVAGGSVALQQGLASANFSASTNYHVSEDGTLFYMADRTAAGQPLVWVDRTGLVDMIDTIPPGVYDSPRLSPDGDRLLTVLAGDAWIFELGSGRVSQVTTDGALSLYADWTPSGDDIVYTALRESPGDGVWIQSADGSGSARQLTSIAGGADFESWAPDGRTFAAHQHDAAGAGSDLLMVPFDGAPGEPERWLDRAFSDVGAVFSPDGRYVAYMSDQTGQREIYIRPFPGPGGQETVSIGGGDEAAWAANGELFYRRPSDYAMMVVDVSTDPTLTVGQPRELFRGGAYEGGSSRAKYAVTADGARFLMSAHRGPSADAAAETGASVVITQNWATELETRVPSP